MLALEAKFDDFDFGLVLANRHSLWIIGDLQESKFDVKRANLASSGVLQLPHQLDMRNNISY